MPFDRFMIAPLDSGLETNLRPWLIPDKAFERLQNAYVFRGRIRKRFGSILMRGTVAPTAGREQLQSRLRINIGTTAAVTGNFGPFVVPGAIFKAGQAFSIGDTIFTVISNVAGPQAMLSTGVATGTYDVATGTVTITGNNENPSTAVFFYPAEPVMGLMNYEVIAVNNEPIFAFDTQFAYQFTATGWVRLGTAVWTGTNADFFWGANWRGITDNVTLLFVTNYVAADLIKFWDGAAWTNFNPVYNAGGQTIRTARIIVPFKDRLVLLNTVETVGGIDTTFVNRCRFSQNGDPRNAANSFLEDTPGRGGFIDAPTKEAIVTAQFLKDRLIVYFETSTWELVYTGNEILPFRWQQINTELGAESTLSQVPFDKVVLGVGNVGIHACNGINVERIDDKIPDEVFEIHNENNGIERVSGIRDYYAEMVYWTFPSSDTRRNANFPYPNRVLVFNYATGSWALNDDSFTVFGYYQNIAGSTWASTLSTWANTTSTWGSAPLQALFRNVVAGNQEGYVLILKRDVPENAISLQITNIITTPATRLTVVDHNLEVGDYILIENAEYDDASNGLNDQIFQVIFVVDEDNIDIGPIALFTGNYIGGGTIRRVSQIDILTKQYNFYQQKGQNVFIEKVDFMVDKTANGEILVDYYTSSTNQSLVQGGVASGSILGTNVLETRPYALINLEQFQDRLWHPTYLSAEGETIQLRIFLNDIQMRNPDIALSDFQMHAMIFYSIGISRLQ